MDETLPQNGSTNYVVESPRHQLKNLRKRNQLFRGASVPAAGFRQTSGPPRPLDPDTPGLGSKTANALESHKHAEGANTSPRILHEISNMSMRKRRKSSSSGGVAGNINVGNTSGSENTRPSFSSHSSPDTSSGFDSPLNAASVPKPVRSRPSPKPEYRRHVRVHSRAFGSRRSSSGETSRYIEYLESSLVAMQTQLQSIISPSNKRNEAAKLRNMCSENHSLQQEVAEWETKFNTRLRDHKEQYEVATEGLRAQMRALQKENESLKSELESRSGNLDATENANHDLERRLELMSELLAASPTKLELHSVGPELLKGQRRKTYHPRIPETGASSKPLFSPERRQSLRIPQSTSSVIEHGRLLPSPQEHPEEEKPFDFSKSPRDSLSSADVGSEVSESTLIESLEASPSRRRSWMRPQHLQPENVQQRSNRRMRRFYSGCNGPRSLILPTATSDTMIASTPGHGLRRPSLPESVASDIPPAVMVTPWSADRERAKPCRSSTWDEGVSTTSQERRRKNQLLSTTDARQAECGLPGEDRDSSRSTHSTASFGHAPGRNLFDELSRIKYERDSTDSPASSNSRPMTAVKHLDSISQAHSDDDSPHHVSAPSQPRGKPPSPQSHPPEPISSPPTRRFFFLPFSTTSDTSCLLLPFLPQTWTHLANLPQLLSAHLPPARHVVASSWHRVVISRPVLEFRWWLVRLLLGRLRDHGQLLCVSPSSPARRGTLELSAASPRQRPASHCSGTPDRRSRDADVVRLVVAQEKDGRGKEIPLPPPVTWLRFGMMMVCAVGIAIRDGPGSLFQSSDGTDDSDAREHDGFAVLEVEDTPAAGGCVELRARGTACA